MEVIVILINCKLGSWIFMCFRTQQSDQTRFNLPGEICPYCIALLNDFGSASEGLDLTWSKLLPGRYKHPTLSCFILGCTCVGARYNGLKVVLDD